MSLNTMVKLWFALQAVAIAAVLGWVTGAVVAYFG